MTDDTTGTDPLDVTGPDTPGPEATPEQEAFVSGLLGSLREDDPGIPDHVAARIDGVLAELARSSSGAVAAAGTGLAGAAALVDGEDQTSPAHGTVTVLPAPRERRPSATTRTFRWVAGAAAAIVVIGGGAAVIRGAGTGSSSSATSAGAAAPEAGDPVPIRSSGTEYSSQDLEAKAQRLVSGFSGVPASGSDGSSGTPRVSASGKVPGALLRPETLADCIEQLTGRPGVVPIAVDQGTYDGKPADIVVLPSADDPTKLEVWAIGPGCTKDDSTLYEYRVISSPAPAPDPTVSPEPSTPAQPSVAAPSSGTGGSGGSGAGGSGSGASATPSG
ncbi:MAG: hypothetical protein U0S36_04025 [Candidatus Nanopelagicales bacterium]